MTVRDIFAPIRDEHPSEADIAAVVAAAAGHVPPRPEPLRRRSQRRRMLAAAAVAAVVAPAALAGSGVLDDADTDSGRFPDGSSFEVRTVPNAQYGTCEEMEIRSPRGDFGGLSTACPAAGAADRPSDRLRVGWLVAPGGTLLLEGIAPDGTTSVEVANAIGAVRFNAASGKFVAHVPGDADFSVVARDAEGKQLDRYEGPPEFWKDPAIPEPASGAGGSGR